MSTLLCVSHPNCAVPFACRNDRHLGRAFDARRPLILGDTVDGLGAVFSPDEWREVYLEVKEVETMLDRLVMWEAQAGGGGGGGGGGESGGSVSPAAPSTNKKKKKKPSGKKPAAKKPTAKKPSAKKPSGKRKPKGKAANWKKPG